MHGEFRRSIQTKEERAAKQGKMLNGRQIYWYIDDHFRISEVEGAVMEFTDLLDLELVGDNLQAFENDWETVWEGMRELPTDTVAERLYRRQLEKLVQLKVGS